VTTFAKGMIIAGVSIVLIVIVGIGLAVYWVAQRSGPLMAKAKEAMEDGVRVGGSTDNKGCVAEALTRYKKERGFTSAVTSNTFLTACLKVSRPTEGFCDDVPGVTEFMKTAEWQKDRCAREGLVNDAYCPQLFTPIASYCEQRRRGEK
jgi:hypothetical protein